jgi:ribonuclease HI
MSTDATCAACGSSFTPSPQLRERYPGWTPRECPSCYRAARGTKTRSRPRGRSSPGMGAAREPEGRLTTSEVLERYHDGPDTGVFTDGSAIPNPGPGGWGAVWVIDGEVQARDHGHDPDTTNNRMELMALHRGIELVPAGTAATVHSDSNLVVRTVTEWAAGWERRGWRRKGGPVENLDLVRPLYELVRSRPEIDVVWIRAHAGNRWNEYADALATAWMRDEV